jgi:hypothetical protein
MKRSIHRSACAALALFALSLTGVATQCSVKWLAVEIPDLEANQIEGIQLWRGDQETSQIYDENVRILFGDRLVSNGSELIEYRIQTPEGEPIPAWSHAAIDRGEGGNGPIRLYFVLGDWSEQPGWFRVSTFNAVGESDLSAESVFL